MDALYYDNYDKLYAGKDYRSEVQTLLDVCGDVTGRMPVRVLDVGCGTGRHAAVFAEEGCEVMGVDVDPGVIEIARARDYADGASPVFHVGNVAELEAGEFDLAVSLFNVVNYLRGLEPLLGFFRAVRERIAPGGLYVFDCWNGLAAILDPPRDENRRIEAGDERIDVATRPRVDWMEQLAIVDNRVVIHGTDGSERAFDFRYEQTLWTPSCLNDALGLAGLETLNVCAWMKPGRAATPKTWKVMFVCRNPES
jgi:SAM-dependent methyltransferase